MSDTFPILVKTYFGFEELLADELRALGVKELEILRRAVKCESDMKLLYRCNYELRTAVSVLRPIHTFKANNEEQLYQGVQDINWEDYLDVEQTFAINSNTFGELFTHSHYAGLKAKDAIVDQFRDRMNRRPSVNVESPDLYIDLHIAHNECTISLNSSGESLSKRGYRSQQTKAPMNEALAAGIIKLSGWTPDLPFLDPMCGSGTFPIEAAMMATNTPSGSFRSFAFERWKSYDSALWKEVKREAEQNRKMIPLDIRGADKNQLAIRISQANATDAGFEDYIKFERKNLLNTKALSDHGTIIINPPYGARLEDENEMDDFYADLGSHLKHAYNGWDAWIFSGNLEALKCFGLRTSRKIKLYNGPIECRLHHYTLYKGSRRYGNPDQESN